MPTYVVRARDNKGNLRKEKISANSPGEARTALREQGLYVQQLTEAQGLMETLNSLNLEDLQNSMASVTVKDKAVFSRQFAVMVNAGVAMVRSLGILADQCPNPN